ncbi:MAG: selenide, water dikinase SelD [Bacteroidetes bacterium 4484_249]|nr:MAG: selenide, water dikinase SelD [Bacteroidetes bacterium 4484_249]
MELKSVSVNNDFDNYDLLKLVDQGGCSAKLSAVELDKALAELPKVTNENLLVDIETHDDAGVFKINDNYALVLTTDFFPPVCSDPYDFGQIAAANALSDVYAMGGQVLTALNLVLFPANIPMSVLKDILRGGHDKVAEAGGVIVGGHTIADDIPKYGLAVTGWVHPDKVITNAGAKPGDVLILTKPIGTGAIISAQKINLAEKETYDQAIETMKLLNKRASEIMSKYSVKCATDITGFGLLGHALKMATGSDVSIRINADSVPAIDKVLDLIDLGCIPGAAFRNLEYVENDCSFDKSVDYNHKMLLLDAQTSGGLFISSPRQHADNILKELKDSDYPESAIIGEVTDKTEKYVNIH